MKGQASAGGLRRCASCELPGAGGSQGTRLHHPPHRFGPDRIVRHPVLLEAGMVGALLLINVLLGIVQEGRADRGQ